MLTKILKYGVLSCLIINQKTGLTVSYPQPEKYTSADGLTHNYINHILLDTRNFLWIGTQCGLNRYDGYSFVNFTKTFNDSNSLSDNFITSLVNDCYGNIWIGTHKGLNYYNIKTSTFKTYYNYPADSNSISGNLINDIYIDNNNIAWILCRNTLDRFDHQNNKIKHYKIPVITDDLPGFTLYTLKEDMDENIWIGSSMGLFCFNKKQKRFINTDFNLSGYSVKAIFPDHTGEIWIGTNNGLFKIGKNRKNFEKYNNKLTLYNPVLGNSINSLAAWNANNLIIGTELGLYIFNIQKKVFKSIEKYFISDNHLGGIYVTSINTVSPILQWIGTSHGLIKLNKDAIKFKNYNKKNIPGLKDENVKSIYEDKYGFLWIGTGNNGLNIINRRNGEVINYNKHTSIIKNRINSNKVFVIFEDSEGNIYLGTDNGVNFHNPVKKCFENLCSKFPSDNCNKLQDKCIYDISEDSLKNLWFATNQGLYSLNLNTNKFISFHEITNNQQSLNLNEIFVIEINGENNLWLGTNKGLICFNPASNKFVCYSASASNKKHRLNSNSVYSLYLDSKNLLWVGTSEGLTMINQSAEKCKKFTKTEGLAFKNIYAIVEDNNRNLWLSTDKEIIKYDNINKTFRNYNTTEGLLNNEFNRGAYFKNIYGEIFFGGIHGFSSFYPDSFTTNSNAPQVEITKIKYLYRDSIYNIYREVLDSFILSTGKYITIEFSALDFIFPGKNQYKYAIYKAGGNPKWINNGNKNFVNITNLSPGKYNFQVKGSNNDLTWNNKGKSLKIIIMAPIWRSNKALFLYSGTLVLLILLFSIYRYKKINKLRIENKERESNAKKILDQKEELALKNKNIMDSINYAKRIQSALMPPRKLFKSIFPDSFILHIPKDIVSGDFYWINKTGDRAFIAAIDCTGHGVPGAFMSIIGFELFRNITNIERIKQPSQILAHLNADFQKIFQDVENMNLRDGMDIAFCSFNRKKMVLEFAGALNPMYLIRDNKIHEFKGDRFSVGLDKSEDFKSYGFKNHTIPIENGDIIYIFSDGYADQFGGPEGKKFKYRRFRHLLLTIHQLPMSKQHEYLENSILKWKGDLEQVDDILVIGFKINSE